MQNAPKKYTLVWIIAAIFIGVIIAFRLYLWERIVKWQEQKRAMELMIELGAGINIGNDLDVRGDSDQLKDASIYEYETYWGNVPVTKDVFKCVSESGFKTVRIPVSWYVHTDSKGMIEEAWMARVREVVDMALDNGLYVILNNHHENFIIPDYEHEESSKETLVKLWKQIAEEFKEYDERLFFEGMNEPRMKDTSEEWTDGSEESREVVNNLNEAFVDTVRSTGSNNKHRYLLIPAYCSSSKRNALSDLRIPENDTRIMVSIHGYLPHRFTDEKRGHDNWDEKDARNTEDIQELKTAIQENFLANKIPVVITEFGCDKKPSDDERIKWLKYYVGNLAEKGVPCIWWDNGKEEMYRIIDRENAVITKNELVDTFISFYDR